MKVRPYKAAKKCVAKAILYVHNTASIMIISLGFTASCNHLPDSAKGGNVDNKILGHWHSVNLGGYFPDDAWIFKDDPLDEIVDYIDFELFADKRGVMRMRYNSENIGECLDLSWEREGPQMILIKTYKEAAGDAPSYKPAWKARILGDNHTMEATGLVGSLRITLERGAVNREELGRTGTADQGQP